MPFTFSHPALVLPVTYLPQKYYSLTGLIIGSMTPDFEYFIRMKIQSNYGHTIAGLLYFDLPLGILFAFIFHNLIRDSLYRNMPNFIKFRLSSFLDFNWNKYFLKNWLVIVLSILLGAASHLLWDSITHRFGYFVESIPYLSTRIGLFGHFLPIYTILQHTSTLLGGLIIFFSFNNLPLNPINSTINLKYWITILFISTSILIIRFLTGLDIKMIGKLIATSISALTFSFIITPIFVRERSNCL